ENALGPLSRWQRAYYAQAVDILNKEGAAVVGIDITFPDNSTHGKEDDENLARVLKEYPKTVLAARYYFDSGVQKLELPNQTISVPVEQLGLINVILDT